MRGHVAGSNKYGLSRQIVPKILPEMLTDTSRAASTVPRNSSCLIHDLI